MSSTSGQRRGAALPQNSLNSGCSSPMARAYSARKSSHSERSSIGSPEKGGGSSGSFSSSGLQETMRTHGRPLAGMAGNATRCPRRSRRAQLVEDLGQAVVDVARAVTSACQVGR